MKIIIAAGIYPPDIGGPATYSQLIAREFSKQGIDVEVICYGDKENYSDDKKESFSITRIYRGYVKPTRYFLYFWNLLRIAGNADVIYAQGPLAAGLPAMWVSRVLKKKFIVKIVGDYAWEQAVNQFRVKDLIEDFQKREYNKAIETIRRIQKKVVGSADKIIVPSEFLKKIVVGWGADKNKIKVVYNAYPETRGVKKKPGLRGDTIISGGRLEPWKGVDTLIDIMPDLLKKNPDFRLLIFGKGPLERTLKHQIKNFKHRNRVKLIGRVPHSELMGYFKSSKFFVLNTGYEGLSHLVLEAMAMELPIVVSNVCGNPELVKNNHSGLLVEYNNKKQLKNAILKLWKDKKLQKKFIENGKKTLENFTLNKMINNTLEILR